MNDKSENFEYKSDVKDSAFLGTLEGPCADIINPTRNNRAYSEELWEKVFNSPIVNELIDNGGIIGEGMHPLDGRDEVDIEKAAIIMKEKPVKKNGKLWAKFKILNTPVGRIVKALCDAGFNIGVSSRGSGDVTENFDGTETVDADTYDFKCFDCVFLPAVKTARMKYVAESLSNKKVSLKEALNNELNNASEKDKVIMEEVLDSLKIDYKSEKASNINENVVTDAVENNEAENNTLSMLQESIKQKKELEQKIIVLNEKLSVSYAKENTLLEQIDKYKLSINKLSENTNRLKALQEKFEKQNVQLKNVKGQLEINQQKVEELNEELSKSKSNRSRLNEVLLKKDNQIEILNEKLQNTNDSLSKQNEKIINESVVLKDSVENLKKDLSIKQSEYSNKIASANKLVEKYKNIALKAVDKYVDSQAIKLGVSSNEIKNKLPESYTFDDIDLVCEDLSAYRINISKLPFQTHSLNENIQIGVKPSQNEFIKTAVNSSDDIDNQLLNLAGLK